MSYPHYHPKMINNLLTRSSKIRKRFLNDAQSSEDPELQTLALETLRSWASQWLTGNMRLDLDEEGKGCVEIPGDIILTDEMFENIDRLRMYLDDPKVVSDNQRGFSIFKLIEREDDEHYVMVNMPNHAKATFTHTTKDGLSKREAISNVETYHVRAWQLFNGVI